MKKKKESSIFQAGGAPVTNQTEPVQPIYQQTKLALDVHAGDLMVVRMVDGAKPQPPRKMSTERFLEWVAKQKAQSREVIRGDEVGPTGFWLQRQFSAGAFRILPILVAKKRMGLIPYIGNLGTQCSSLGGPRPRGA